MPAEVLVRRVYDVSPAADGVRVLVDRIWPRGLRKDAARDGRPLILLTATRDADHSQAAVLAQLLQPSADPAKSPGRYQ